jgi:hypothetical protein
VDSGSSRDGTRELAPDLVSFLDGALRHFTEVSSAAGKCSGDVEMKVRDRLMCGRSVILPDGHTGTFENLVDRVGGVADGNHEVTCFRVGQIKQRGYVPGGDDKQMRDSSLFSRHQNGNAVFPP